MVTINITVFAKTKSFIISNAERSKKKIHRNRYALNLYFSWTFTDPPAFADSPQSQSSDPGLAHPCAHAAADPCYPCFCPPSCPCGRRGRDLCRVRFACACRSLLMYWQRQISWISLHPNGAQTAVARGLFILVYDVCWPRPNDTKAAPTMTSRHN